MTPARKALLDKAKSLAKEAGPDGLIGNAVEDAMEGLIQNWSDALREKSIDPNIVVDDLFSVIAALSAIHNKLAKEMPNALERMAEIL